MCDTYRHHRLCALSDRNLSCRRHPNNLHRSVLSYLLLLKNDGHLLQSNENEEVKLLRNEDEKNRVNEPRNLLKFRNFHC